MNPNPNDFKTRASRLSKNYQRPSKVLPTLAQSFSSSSSHMGIDFDSKLKYLDSYKNLKKITEMRSHHLQPQTPISSYLSKLSEKSLVPLPMGLIKKQGVCEKLDVSNLSMGDHYAVAMAEGLKTLKVRKVILKNNGLTDSGASSIVSSLDPRYSTELNLAENHISFHTVTAICKLNSNGLSRLSILNLENNNLCDKNVAIIVNAFTTYDKIRELSFSRNKISEEGTLAIASYLKYTSVLQKLDLSWNSIRGYEGKLLCKSLLENESLRVLDLSWNSLTSPSEENCAAALAEVLRVNATLVHLDLSNNMLSLSDCKILEEGIKYNHTLLGLHIEGNHAEIDSRGYLLLQPNLNIANSLNISRMMHRPKGLKRKNKSCWICQKWNEMEFKWRNGKSGPYGEEPIMVHLDFENYIGSELQEHEDTYYRLIRMCPPGPVNFFFTLRGKFVISSEYSKVDQVVSYEGHERYGVNVVEINPSPSQLWFELRPKARPREEKAQKLELPPWDFGKSVFREYCSDTAELLNECFNEDMQRSKIRELTGKEYEYLIDYLKQYYSSIKETYKHLAAKAWLEWDRWLQVLYDFFYQNNMFGTNDLRPYDVECIIKTFRYWNSTTEIYFARYQFLELLVRVSIMKFYRNRQTSKISAAVKLMFKTFYTAFDKHSSNDFRIDKLYTKAVDKILYRHYSTLIKLYYHFAVDNLMTLEGLYKMLQCVTKEYEDIQSCFILSRETSVTYAYYNDTIKFVEFLEALVRVADLVKYKNNVQTRLDLFVEEIIELKLEALLQTSVKAAD